MKDENNKNKRKLETQGETQGVKNENNIGDTESIASTMKSQGYYIGLIAPFLYLAMTLANMDLFGDGLNPDQTTLISGSQYQTNFDQYYKVRMTDKDYLFRTVKVLYMYMFM